MSHPRREECHAFVFAHAAAVSLCVGLLGLLEGAVIRDLLWRDAALLLGARVYGGVHLAFAALFSAAAFRPRLQQPAAAAGFVASAADAGLWALLVSRGASPLLLVVPVFTSLARFLPFGLRLLDGRDIGAAVRRAAPWAAAVVHTAAAFAMAFVIAPYFEKDPLGRERFVWFQGVEPRWAASWGLWMLGALTLIAFYGWWGSFLPSSRASRAAFALACIGATFDLGCEAVLAFGTSEVPRHWPHALGLITTIFANGLYCVAGVVLTLATPTLPRWLRAWTWALWLTGFAMTAAGLADSLAAIKVTTALLTVLLCPWFLAMGRFLNRSAVPA